MKTSMATKIVINNKDNYADGNSNKTTIINLNIFSFKLNNIRIEIHGWHIALILFVIGSGIAFAVHLMM
jgi:hypothetical protein